MTLRNPLPTRAACIALAALSLCAAAPASAADTEPEGNWMVRMRGTYLKMDNSSDQIGGVGAHDRVTTNNKWIPELDVTYFITPHIATELVLTVPQSQDVYLDGNKIGSFKHLPPSIMLQYHLQPEGTFRPYLGVGLNVTRIWGANLAGGLALDQWSVGPALQVGMDYRLSKHWFLNADIKKIWISSDIKSNGTKVSSVSLDPWLFSMGVGYRF